MISRRAFTARELSRGTTIGHCKLDRIAPPPVRKVRVGGDDVAGTLIDAGVAREYDGKNPTWCG